VFKARYYNGRDTRVVNVQCHSVDGAALNMRGNGVDQTIALAQIRVSPRLGRTHRTLFLPQGAQIQTDDNDAVDALVPRRNRMESLVDRLERHWRVVAGGVFVIAIALIFGFIDGLPWAAERVAQRIPQSLERSIGEQSLEMLKQFALKPTQLPVEKQKQLRRRFADFVRDVPDGANYRVEFFDAPGIGANAFALPGETIVFTDEIVKMFANDEEFLAVAAHEIGHEEHRHLMRAVLQGSGVIVVGAMLSGDVGSASTVVVAIPTFLLQSHYSRAFETEADDYAFAALQARGISPHYFAEVMRKFEQKYEEAKDGTMAYASSHPPTDARIERAEVAARAFDARPSKP
jgi:Zn-dependent protease with chaperone function